jgi:hypothetical protein
MEDFPLRSGGPGSNGGSRSVPASCSVPASAGPRAALAPVRPTPSLADWMRRPAYQLKKKSCIADGAASVAIRTPAAHPWSTSASQPDQIKRFFLRASIPAESMSERIASPSSLARCWSYQLSALRLMGLPISVSSRFSPLELSCVHARGSRCDFAKRPGTPVSLKIA